MSADGFTVATRASSDTEGTRTQRGAHGGVRRARVTVRRARVTALAGGRSALSLQRILFDRQPNAVRFVFLCRDSQ